MSFIALIVFTLALIRRQPSDSRNQPVDREREQTDCPQGDGQAVDDFCEVHGGCYALKAVRLVEWDANNAKATLQSRLTENTLSRHPSLAAGYSDSMTVGRLGAIVVRMYFGADARAYRVHFVVFRSAPRKKWVEPRQPRPPPGANVCAKRWPDRYW